MPDVAPFVGIRFDPSVVDLSAVTSPPYDVISEAERIAYEKASPYNIVRLILGPSGVEHDRYAVARELMDSWLAEGVLTRDALPSLTIYEESFSIGGAFLAQVGVLAAVEISGEILPHERTMTPVVEDRLEVIRAARANLSPVFCIYWSDEEALQVPARPPDADFRTEELGHRAWTITDAAEIEQIQKRLSGARVVIADGHHRYRTAEAYRDERRAADGAGPWDRMLLYMVDAERTGPALLPIHRLVSGVSVTTALDALRALFDVSPFSDGVDELAAAVEARRSDGRCYGLHSAEGSWIVSLKDEASARRATEGSHSDAWRSLDVAVLHELVFNRLLPEAGVTFVHSPGEAAEAVREGRASFSVLLAPTPVAAVREVAEAHDSMPSKSTFFVPKPRTGIVIRPLDA